MKKQRATEPAVGVLTRHTLTKPEAQNLRLYGLFWTGLLFILFFSVQLRWLPVGGIQKGIAGFWHSLILPAVTVSFGQIPPLVRSLRERLLAVLNADFVTTLRAAKIPKNRILYGHVLRNAFVPTLMLFSVNLY